MSNRKSIQVFEHETLYYGREHNSVFFTLKHFDALAKLNILHNNKYFTLVHKGIKFSQFVGVVQIDNLTIEILPKVDKTSEAPGIWRNVLIEMLRSTRKLKINQVGQANVNKQNRHLLDIYFDWFLREVEVLLRQGLIKKYYKQTKNVNALKGKLEFAGHISKNLIHKERFYTTHQIYDKDHEWHQILNQALLIIEQLSKGSYLYHKCKRVQLGFPEVAPIKCTATTFDKLILNRKSQPYAKALEIARLIILNYAPNVSSGSERMLALLFDMNNLWEEYILMQLKKACINTTYKIEGQQSKIFWGNSSLRPDVVIKVDKETRFIIDTKWKQINANQPSVKDLRQMYVYNDHWKSKTAILLYPGTSSGESEIYLKEFNYPNHSCGILKINILNANGELDEEIGTEIMLAFEEKVLINSLSTSYN